MTDKLIRTEALQRYNGIEADAEGVYVMLDDVRALLAEAQPEEPGEARLIAQEMGGLALVLRGEGSPEHSEDLRALADRGRALAARPAEEGLRDTVRLDWLESVTTLHTAPVFLYVVDGYEVSVERDGNEAAAIYRGVTLRSAIDAALTLVPDLWGWKISRAETLLWSPDGGPLSAETVVRATHPVPAIALCIAALKARADQ